MLIIASYTCIDYYWSLLVSTLNLIGNMYYYYQCIYMYISGHSDHSHVHVRTLIIVIIAMIIMSSNFSAPADNLKEMTSHICDPKVALVHQV